MSLYQRGNVYWCRWKIQQKEIRETTGTSDFQAAQEYHDRRRAEIWRSKQLGDVPQVTWEQAALAWIDEHAQHKKSYETDIQRLRWLNDKLSGSLITQLTTDLLLQLRKLLLENKAASTANRHLAVVSAILHHAHAKGTLASVPKIPYLPESKERFRWLTREQAIRLIDELPEHLSAMTRFALATGLRRSNITGMTWDALDAHRKIAWVWPDEAKAGKPIAVPLNSDALAVLFERNGINSRYVFTYRNQPIYHATTKAWVKALERAGIEAGFTFHDLRHTWASWHVMGGTPLEVLRQLGGWADMTMVLRYAHLSSGYVAGYADNVCLAQKTAQFKNVSEDYREEPSNLGWLMGLEPTTTGITILDSTN